MATKTNGTKNKILIIGAGNIGTSLFRVLKNVFPGRIRLFGNHEFGIQFIKLMANQVSETEENLINLAYDSVRQKVAKALVTLFKKYEANGQARFSILREDLAALAATAKETVIRTISDFKDEGLISIIENDIVIKSVDNLERLRF